jgi:glc operon protein GlcG
MKLMLQLVLTSATILFALTVQAQVIEKKVLSLEGAKRISAAAEARAKAEGARVVIAVVDDGGSLLLLERLDDTQVASVNVGIDKARTAAIFRRPSKVFEDQVRDGRVAALALHGAVPLQGGVPIIVEGQVVGAIGVSGETPQQDEEIAKAGAQALESMDMAGGIIGEAHAPLPVTYLESRQVSAAFRNGAVLVGEDETIMHAARNYMVHASHRDKPGMVEIHELDTDIVYVLEGTATVVTGGASVGTNTVAPHELRGTSMTGGETRQVVPGDVIIIPNGVPHWFKEVSAPFNYYVVKVR